MGQLNRPMIPAVRGLADFNGEYFHSAEWRHDVDLTGKRVASIGNAASAVQYVPLIAPKVDHLTVFQRSANWIMPRNQIVFSAEQLDAYERGICSKKAGNRCTRSASPGSSARGWGPARNRKARVSRWRIFIARCPTRYCARN